MHDCERITLKMSFIWEIMYVWTLSLISGIEQRLVFMLGAPGTNISTLPWVVKFNIPYSLDLVYARTNTFLVAGATL